MWLAECLPLLLLWVYIRYQGVVSRVSTSVITLGVYQVERCGKQSVCLCYYCRCISVSKVWLAECLPVLLL